MTSTIADALRRASPGGTWIESRALLRHVLDCDDGYLVAHADQPLTSRQQEAFETLAARRRQGEPVAYLTGAREFFGLEFTVSPAVLIPRPESELLVERVLDTVPEQAEARILDLGTGSGCVAIAIARHRPRALVFAVDRAEAALVIARENARRHGALNVRVMRGDWFIPVQQERFDIIAANPPYVAAGDPHLEAGDVRFEPRDALVAGPAGTECIAAITAAAPRHLAPGGRLLIEHSYDQGAAVRDLLHAAGFFGSVTTWRDLAGMERVSDAQVDLPQGSR